jgi:hypothetical protein
MLKLKNLGMNLAMKKNSIEKIIIIKLYMFTTSILRVGKKETILCKKHSYIFKYLKYIFQSAKN